MNKQVIITVVLILLAAAAFTWWDSTQKAERNLAPSQKYAKWKPVAISEPPISEQIEAQIKSIETGKTVPLPIPLYIAGEKIDRLDVDWLREKLKALGYEETELGAEFAQVTDDAMKGISDLGSEEIGIVRDFLEGTEVVYAYVHPDLSEILLLQTSKFESQTSSAFLVFSKHSDGVKDVPGLLAASKRAGAGFGVYVGRLHIGIPLAEVDRELANFPAWTMKRERMAATNLLRGNFGYTFISLSGKLESIMVMSSDFEHWEKLKGFSEERRRKFITAMFKNKLD